MGAYRPGDKNPLAAPLDAIDQSPPAPRTDGVKGGGAAERSSGTLDAAEHGGSLSSDGVRANTPQPLGTGGRPHARLRRAAIPEAPHKEPTAS
jgi:hypothetical protein